MPWIREEKYFPYYLFRDKILQDCIKIDTVPSYNHVLLQRQEAQNRRNTLIR